MWSNIANQVKFHEAAILSQKQDIARLEISAHPVLSSLCQGIPCARRGHSDVKMFLLALGKLTRYDFIRQNIFWQKLYAKSEQDLPGYFYNSTMKYEYPALFKNQVLFPEHGELLSRKIFSGVHQVDIHKNYLQGHIVEGKYRFPTTGYLQIASEIGFNSIRDLEIHAPLFDDEKAILIGNAIYANNKLNTQTWSSFFTSTENKISTIIQVFF